MKKQIKDDWVRLPSPSYKQKGNYSGVPRLHTAIIVDVKPRDKIKGEYDSIKQCDANLYIEDNTSRISYIGAGLFCLFLTIMGYVFDKETLLAPPKNIMETIVIFGWVITMIGFILYGLLIPKKLLILNQKEGNITIPRMFWRKPVTFSFGDGIAAVTSVKTGGITHRVELWPYDKRSKGGVLYTSDLSGTTSYIEEYWSFVVWYMDCNRPLPPGKLFDPYRDADFERRKSEGFPPPLYPSYIPTPEATREQQKERGKVWTEEFR